MPEEVDLIDQSTVLVNRFSGQGLMLPVERERYVELTELGLLFVALVGDELVGTAAISQLYPGQVCELGGAAVEPEYQGQGIGTAMFVERLKLAQSREWRALVFANGNSKGIIERQGGELVEDMSLVPPEALALCATCPNYTGNGCCDDIYVFNFGEGEGK